MNALDYILTVGPFKGHRVGDAGDLYRHGERVYGREEARREGLPMHTDCVSWMGWYLSHQAKWMAESGREAADRGPISKFMIANGICRGIYSEKPAYNVEPYISWAAAYDKEP